MNIPHHDEQGIQNSKLPGPAEESRPHTSGIPDLASAAVRLADLDYAVFPCKPGDKVPATAHGVCDATSDVAEVAVTWGVTPNANIGLSAKGLLIVDVDVPSPGEVNPWLQDQPERLDDLSRAPTAVTPRGGRHYYYRRTPGKHWGCTVGKLAPMVDTRTDGGYVVAPPSVRPDGGYHLVPGQELDCPPDQLPEPPAWLQNMLDLIAVAGGGPGDRKSAAVEANPIPQGQRDTALTSLAGGMRRQGMSESEMRAALLVANEERCRPPLPRKDVERIAWSVSRYDPDQVATAIAEDWAGQDAAASRPPSNDPKDPGPFPDKLLDVPGLVGETMRFTLDTSFRRQPALALGGAIALMGTLAARKVMDEENTRTNVYCIGVAPSGGGKERPRQVNREVLYAAGAESLLAAEGIASHAGLVKAVSKKPAALFQLDEVGRLLRTLSNPSHAPHLYGIVTVLLKLYSSAGSVYVGDAYADETRTVTIDQPCASLFATTVPKSLYEGFTAENVEDGFLSRVMIFEAAAELPPKERPPRLDVPESLKKAAEAWAQFNHAGNLNGEHPKPMLVKADDAARAVFDDFDRDAEKELRATGEPIGTLWTRAVEKARKLALIFACSRGVDGIKVDKAAAEWACSLSEHLTRRLAFVASQWVSENAYDARRKRVLRLIVGAGEKGLTKSDLYARTRALTSRERSEVIEALLVCGDVREVREKTGGAPRVSYVAANLLPEPS